MKDCGVSRYQLVEWLDLYDIKPRGVYSWLSGKGETNSYTLSAILDVMAMQIMAQRYDDRHDHDAQTLGLRIQKRF
jgi:hypothetical protein